MALSKTVLDMHPRSSSHPADDAAKRDLLLAKLSRWTSYTIFSLLVIFTAALPHSIKGAQHAWRLAFLLWLIQLLVERRRPFPEPLSAPLLAYITLSGVSTILTADPLLSWDRMKIVCLVLVGILFAQSLKSLSQVKILISILLFSGLAVAAFTGWQYTYGIGVQIGSLPPKSALELAGVRVNDVVTSVDGQKVHTREQLRQQLKTKSQSVPLDVRLLRGFPLEEFAVVLTSDDFIRSGLDSGQLTLTSGKPTRAQGHLGHYVVFAEMLMQLGCMTWAVLLAVGPGHRGWRLFAALVFASLTAALMFTETRAAMAGLAVGCFLVVLLLASPRSRKWAASALLLLVVLALIWTRYVRHVQWIALNDTGTHFRVLMWQDGLRLIGHHPWFGIGMESVRTHWRQWNIRGFAQYHVVSHFHCTFLQIAVDRGLTTLAAWLWFVVAYLAFLIRLVGKALTKSRFAAGVVAGALSGFVAFQVTALVHYNLGEEPLVTVLFFYFGLAIAIDRMLNDPHALDLA